MQRLIATAQQFEGAGILVVGDIMLDRYCYGKVNRISPEAPVPVVDISRTENRPGGAANVALNIKALGAQPFLVSVTGRDPESALLCDLLAHHQILTAGIFPLDYKRTVLKTRIIAGNQQLVRLDEEDTLEIRPETESLLLRFITDCLTKQAIRAIVLQDYNKGLLTPTLIDAIIELALQHHIPIAVDPKKMHFFNYSYVDLFKPNLKEIREALGYDIAPDLESLTEAAEALRLKLRHQHTMITLADKGVFISNSHYNEIIPARVQDIADVSGAGDTVISVAALGLATGADLRDIAMIANTAGGLVCARPGVVPVDKKQLLQLLEQV